MKMKKAFQIFMVCVGMLLFLAGVSGKINLFTRYGIFSLKNVILAVIAIVVAILISRILFNKKNKGTGGS